MELPIRVAETLGRACYFDMDAFAQECDRWKQHSVTPVLKEVGVRLHALLASWPHISATDAYTSYVLDTVLPDEVYRTFYFTQPVDNMLLKIHGAQQLGDAGNVFPFLTRLLDGGAPAGRMACSLIPSIETLLDGDYRLFKESCAFLSCLVSNTEVRGMVASHRLLQNLSRLFRKDCARDIVGIIIKAELHRDILLVYPVVRACARLLYFERSFPQRSPDDAEGLASALELLACCASNESTNFLIIPDVIYVSRRGWLTTYGALVCNMLSGHSVQFVIDLYRAGQLFPLIRKAFSVPSDEGGTLVWLSIRNLIRCQWPSSVPHALNEPSPDEQPVTNLICPITLERMVHPAMASDGHTYERDALIEHILKNGTVSPMTKQQLSYTLYENYDCRNP